MVVRMRHTRSHTGNRRSHHAISAGAMVNCAACGATRLRHRACPACGDYRGKKPSKKVANKAVRKANKKVAKAAKKKETK